MAGSILEQIENGAVYEELTEARIREVITDLMNTPRPRDEPHFVVHGGATLHDEFHRAMEEVRVAAMEEVTPEQVVMHARRRGRSHLAGQLAAYQHEVNVMEYKMKVAQHNKGEAIQVIRKHLKDLGWQ